MSVLLKRNTLGLSWTINFAQDFCVFLCLPIRLKKIYKACKGLLLYQLFVKTIFYSIFFLKFDNKR